VQKQTAHISRSEKVLSFPFQAPLQKTLHRIALNTMKVVNAHTAERGDISKVVSCFFISM
jgi:hypothetical protein